MRIAADNHRRDFRYSESNGLHSQPVMLRRYFPPFIASVDADLNAVCQPYSDAALIELRGGNILDLFIRLASEARWNKFWFYMLEISASGRRAVAFDRLFSLCPEG
ncbi:unnamed protein product [Ectocarpus sp. 12 AP-2014]